LVGGSQKKGVIMDIKWMPLIVGGFIPAVLYGFAGVFQKWSARSEGTVSIYLIGFGLATFVVGWVFRWVLGDQAASAGSFAFSLAGGASFAVGAGLISLAILKFDAAIAQLSPLYNTNVLITVGLGLAIFAESKDLDVGRLLLGALFVIVGAFLVSQA
jgi:transporter family protein